MATDDLNVGVSPFEEGSRPTDRSKSIIKKKKKKIDRKMKTVDMLNIESMQKFTNRDWRS